MEVGVQYKSGSINRNFFMEVNEVQDFANENLNLGIFTTAYRYDNPDIRQGSMLGDFYVDFDIADINEGDNFEKIRRDALRVISSFGGIFGIAKEAIEVYFSGFKGFHIVVPIEVLGIQPHQELNQIFKLIADDLKKVSVNQTVDTRIYDNVRLFRVPNTVHPKTGLYKIPITFDELLKSSLDELRSLAKTPRYIIYKPRAYNTQANRIYQAYIKQWDKEKLAQANRKKSSKQMNLNFVPPCIEHILEEGVKEGKRNNTVAVLASFYLQRGCSESEALSHIETWNSSRLNHPLGHREILTTVTSIYRTERRYGCSTLKDISICSESCKFYKEKDTRGNLDV